MTRFSPPLPGYDVESGPLDGSWRIAPHWNGDARGRLAEIYSDAAFEAGGLPRFVQDNHSWTEHSGVIRGLHFQVPPHAQDKLFRVVVGEIWNVAVDLRPAGFGRVWQERMTPQSGWILLPKGLAHGVQTLTCGVELHYRLSVPFAPTALGAVRYDDPDIEAAWPLPLTGELSARDAQAERLTDCHRYFRTAHL